MANYTKRDERSSQLKQSLEKSHSPAARVRSKPGPPPTLGQELHDGYKWFWFICPQCDRRTPRALAPFAIRYGMNVPTIDIAKFATCQACGHFGALLQRPSMEGIGAEMAIEPFPAELATQGLERWLSRVTRTRCPAPLRAIFRGCRPSFLAAMTP
jgi:hypothetical protein